MTGPSRADKVLRHANRHGQGLEIGPSHSPFAPKKAGFRVDILDHLDEVQLAEKYRAHPVRLDNIEPVDFVWQGESFVALTGRPKHYDWIIASHVIEHTPDLVGFLLECDSILRNTGVISLAIPDKRFCFDHFRPLSSLGRVIDCHVQRPAVHSPGSVAEYCLDVVSCNGQLTWHPDAREPLVPIHTLEDAKKHMQTALAGKDHLDVHAWCFVPHSFRLLIHDLHALGLIPLRELGFYPGAGFEFFVTLSREGAGPGLSRAEMLVAIEAELAAGARRHAGEVPAPPPPSRLRRLAGKAKQLARRALSNSWLHRMSVK